MTDGVNVSFDSMYALQQEMNRTLIGMGSIPQMVADHEARLRVQEKREDLAHRVEVIERERSSDRTSFDKQGERIGRMEQDIAAIKETISSTRPVRVHPIAIVAVVASGSLGTAALIAQFIAP